MGGNGWVTTKLWIENDSEAVTRLGARREITRLWRGGQKEVCVVKNPNPKEIGVGKCQAH